MLYRLLFPPVNRLFWFLNGNFPLFPSRLLLIWQDRNTAATFMKLGGIAADILLALGLYQMAKLFVKNNKSRIPAIILYSALFNPAIIYNSSLWGQIDTIPLAFAVWSFYLLYKNRMILSFVLLCLGLLSKQTIGILVPIYGLLFIKRGDWKLKIKSFLSGAVVFFAVFLPFYKRGNVILFPLITYLRIATQFAAGWLTAHAFNFWYLVHYPGNTSDLVLYFANLTPRFLGTGFVLIGLVGVLYFVGKKTQRGSSFIMAAALLPMLVFLFSTRMHERHLLPAIPFLLLATVIEARFYWLYLYTTLFHFLNLYAAWKQPPVRLLMDLADNRIFVNALIVVQILLCFFIYYYFLAFSGKKTAFLRGKSRKRQLPPSRSRHLQSNGGAYRQK